MKATWSRRRLWTSVQRRSNRKWSLAGELCETVPVPVSARRARASAAVAHQWSPSPTVGAFWLQELSASQRVGQETGPTIRLR